MRRTAALLATVLLAAACAAGDGAVDDAADAAVGTVAGTDVAGTTGDTAEPSTDAAASSGDDVPATLRWTAATLAGEDFAAADLAGGDTILWMWAPWCSVCEREAPEVAAFLADLPDDVELIGVAGRDDVGPMEEFVARHGLQAMTTVVDDDGSIWATYGVTGQPAYVFIDEVGTANVAFGAIGAAGITEGIGIAFG